MPTPTSKIPLPKTSLSSSKLDQDMTISSTPTVSKIPVIKNLKSPAHEIRCVSDKSFLDVSAKIIPSASFWEIVLLVLFVVINVKSCYNLRQCFHNGQRTTEKLKCKYLYQTN